MTRTGLATHCPLTLCATALLAGCATSMSGLSGSSSFACKAPDGVTCDSVSGTYANALHNNLPSQRPQGAAASAPALAASAAPAVRPAVPRLATPNLSPTALRSSPRVLRLWFKPWEDADHDLYDQGYVYVQIDSGQWLIDHVERQIREANAPLRPPPRTTAGARKEGTPPQANTRSAPLLPTPDNPLPGLVPPSGRVESSD